MESLRYLRCFKHKITYDASPKPIQKPFYRLSPDASTSVLTENTCILVFHCLFVSHPFYMLLSPYPLPPSVCIYNIIYFSSGHPCAPSCLLELICCCHDNSTAGNTSYFIMQAHAADDVGGIHGNGFLGSLFNSNVSLDFRLFFN